jgi:hypothetical protein
MSAKLNSLIDSLPMIKSNGVLGRIRKGAEKEKGFLFSRENLINKL